MSTNDKPLIAVAGALSKQGRSVAHTLLQSGQYRVRALTNRANAPEAKRLAQLGAEIAPAPLQPGRRREFVDAFKGAHGAFLITPPLAPPNSPEFEIGKDQADAAVEAGVRQVVFSTLENVDAITGGKRFAPHFTDKARVEEHIRALPVTSSFVSLAYFYTNFIEYYPPHKEGDTLVFPIYLPKDCRAPFVDPTTATGPAVLEMLNNPGRYAGQTMPVIGDMLTPEEMVETFARVTGIKARYASAFKSEELLRYFPFFADKGEFVRETAGMVEYTVEHGYFRKDRDLAWSRRIDPNSLTWEQYLLASGWKGDWRSFGAA